MSVNVIRLSAQRRRAHYWKRLHYIGPEQEAVCKCGRRRRQWSRRKEMALDGYVVTDYRCPCGRHIKKVDW